MQQLTISEMCEAAERTGGGEMLLVCPTCGQIFDGRRGALVRHHKTKSHAALEPSKR